MWGRLTGGITTSLDVVAEVPSTNAELLRAVRSGAATTAGRVLVAEWQSAGRGRFDRVWTSPPRAGLTFSVLLRPAAVPVARRSWLPLLAGTALRAAVLDLLGGGDPLPVWLKWPNDLLVGTDRKKAAGILAETHDDAVALGMGINVHNTRTELPGPGATSFDLAFPQARVDREDLLVAVLAAFSTRYDRWTACDGDADASGLREEYQRACDTIGRAVEVDQPGRRIAGTATGVDAGGALLVAYGAGSGPYGTVTVSAGDVTHVRPRRR